MKKTYKRCRFEKPDKSFVNFNFCYRTKNYYEMHCNYDKVVTEIDAVIEKLLNLTPYILQSCEALNFHDRENTITNDLCEPLLEMLSEIARKILIFEKKEST